MKKIFIVLCTFLFVIALLVFDIQANSKPDNINHEETPAKGTLNDLHLTIEQNKKVEEIIKENQKEMNKIKKELEACVKYAKKIIADYLRENKSKIIDYTIIDSMLEPINKKEVELRKIDTKTQIQIRNVLEPEQRDILDVMLTETQDILPPANSPSFGPNSNIPLGE
jgi:Spy/CpxP family protein refolding chaperone